MDIAKKLHDALILFGNGRQVYMKVTNDLIGYKRLLDVASSKLYLKICVGFEPTAGYHRNITYCLVQQRAECRLLSSLSCVRAREMLYKT
ncbi:IS110 family transposase [Photorhabdus africana]|uniref:IS110 family transposase n=1 Tax=Photorhabdus africana TaxID=3097554 RepID=UPI0034DE8A5C